jgi:protein-S-isoprenylcysteine O-methyltransferase Ste14
MPDDRSKAPNTGTASIVTAAILSGAVIIAVVGTFLPELIGMKGTPAIILRLVFYAVAAIDVAIAFWLRARLNKARRIGGGTVQRR